MIIRWSLGILALLISIGTIIGVSLGSSSQQFWIEQVIIMIPYIIDYGKVSFPNIRYIRNNNEKSYIFISIIVIFTVILSVVELFVAISEKLTISGGDLFLTGLLSTLPKYHHLIHICYIMGIEIFNISSIDIYSINIINSINSLRLKEIRRLRNGRND